MGRLCSLCHSGGDFILPFKSVFFFSCNQLNWNLCYNELVDICHLPISFSFHHFLVTVLIFATFLLYFCFDLHQEIVAGFP